MAVEIEGLRHPLSELDMGETLFMINERITNVILAKVTIFTPFVVTVINLSPN